MFDPPVSEQNIDPVSRSTRSKGFRCSENAHPDFFTRSGDGNPGIPTCPASKYGGIGGASHSPRHLSFLKQGHSTLRRLRIHCTSPGSVKLVEHELWQREEKGLIGILPVQDAAEATIVDFVLSQDTLETVGSCRNAQA